MLSSSREDLLPWGESRPPGWPPRLPPFLSLSGLLILCALVDFQRLHRIFYISPLSWLFCVISVLLPKVQGLLMEKLHSLSFKMGIVTYFDVH